MPRDAPVTRAVLPESVVMIELLAGSSTRQPFANAARPARRDCDVGDRRARPAFCRRRPAHAAYAADLPPSTDSTCPVTKDATGEARNTAALAISSGFATRFIGTPATSPALFSALPVKRSSMPVSVAPGATALTRTPDPAT